MLTGSGDRRCEASEDVLFIQLVDESLVPLSRNKVAAVCIVSFLQNVADLVEVRSHRGQEIHSVLVGCPAGQRLIVDTCTRLIGDGSGGRLIQLLLHFHPALLTLD